MSRQRVDGGSNDRCLRMSSHLCWAPTTSHLCRWYFLQGFVRREREGKIFRLPLHEICKQSCIFKSSKHRNREGGTEFEFGNGSIIWIWDKTLGKVLLLLLDPHHYHPQLCQICMSDAAFMSQHKWCNRPWCQARMLWIHWFVSWDLTHFLWFIFTKKSRSIDQMIGCYKNTSVVPCGWKMTCK